jgi:SAM-dependent methyltransferase
VTVLFDPLAELYERYAEINDEIYRPWITAALPAGGPHERAADLGCGSGRFSDLLADRYRQVLAVDIAEREIAIARRRRGRPSVDYQVRSMLDLTPDRDGRFDLVFSVNALFHTGDPDRVLPHVRSLVRPGGWAVLVDIVSGRPTNRGRTAGLAPLVGRAGRGAHARPPPVAGRCLDRAAAAAASGLDAARPDQPPAPPRRVPPPLPAGIRWRRVHRHHRPVRLRAALAGAGDRPTILSGWSGWR